MAIPDGSLTPAQFEILQLLWNSADGLTVAEVWEAVRRDRDVSRTTVLNLVDRLEKRNWLTRKKSGGVFRYSPTTDRRTTQSQLADSFVDEFFEGSPASFVLSLLGSDRIPKAEVERLKAMLNKTPPPDPSNEES